MSIRFLIVLFLSFATIFAKTNLDQTISKNTKVLNQKRKKADILKEKLEDIALLISKREKEIQKIEQDIKESDKFLNEQKNEYEKRVKDIEKLQKDIEGLNKKRDTTQRELIDIMSKMVSVDIISKSNSISGVDDVVREEGIKSLGKVLDKKFKKIKNRYVNLSIKIENINKNIKKLKSYIKEMQKRKKLLSEMKKKRQKVIKDLKYKKILYDKKLSRIFSEQREIIKTLKKLKILKRAEKKRKKYKANTNINSQKVRKLGTSYQRGKVVRYKGAKTIAPLKNFIVKRKFGEYFDPIYKIKIFNESVILRSKIPNAKVKNVLNGKVIFAKSTPMLDNVVIVESSNSIHTIYAHLSKIAPTIKKGKRIKKGYVIGRVDRDLTFEVVQKNRHINPLEMIRF